MLPVVGEHVCRGDLASDLHVVYGDGLHDADRLRRADRVALGHGVRRLRGVQDDLEEGEAEAGAVEAELRDVARVNVEVRRLGRGRDGRRHGRGKEGRRISGGHFCR